MSMPSIQIPVLPSSNMDFFRQSINILANNINDIFDRSFVVNGNVIITVSNPLSTALNVSNGVIRGNGALLFSINAASLLGTSNNSQLQNSTLRIITANGLFANASIVELGNTVTLNVNVADSITNNSNNIPASANSLRWALNTANANSSNATLVSYLVSEERGGTGKSTYISGQLLIGNSFSGKLDSGNIIAGAGILVTRESGSITISSNLIQGEGMLFQSSGNSGITITSNVYPDGNLTQAGIVRLHDYANSTSNTLAVTPNAVNSLILNLNSIPVKNTYGRLLSRQVYTTSNFAGVTGRESGTTYTWSKPENTDFINIVVLSGGAAGGSSLNVWNDSETSWFPKVYNVNNTIGRLKTAAFWGSSGEAGSVAYWNGPASTFSDTITLFVGGGGTTRGGGKGNGADSWFSSTSFLRVPGAPSTNNRLLEWGTTGYSRRKEYGKNFPNALDSHPVSPYSDMAGASDVYTRGTTTPGTEFRSSIKGSNTSTRDSGTYTQSSLTWDIMKGISKGISNDLPALGIPHTGITSAAGGSTDRTGTDPNPGLNSYTWPIYGGKGGSSPFGRGGYGSLFTGEKNRALGIFYTAGFSGSAQGYVPISGPVVSGAPVSGYNNDLWYDVGSVEGGSETIYCIGESSLTYGGTNGGSANSAAPHAYGAAPHILSISRGENLTSTTSAVIILPPDRQAGERLIVLFGDRGNSGRTVSPSGWTNIIADNSFAGTDPSGNVQSVFFITRDLDGTEDPTITITTPTSTTSLWYIFRIAAGTYQKNGSNTAPVGAGRRNVSNPPGVVDLTNTIPASWGRRTNTILYITAVSGNTNSSAGLPTFDRSPQTIDLSWEGRNTGGTSSADSFLGYALKISKEVGANTNNAPTNISGGGPISNTWNISPNQGSFYDIGTIAVRGNTSAPWNFRTDGTSVGGYFAGIPRSTWTVSTGIEIPYDAGYMESGVWYYKFEHGQDATGYGAGGGGAIKGTGNHPWDGRTWQVHGGNGSPGLIIVEAYSDS